MDAPQTSRLFLRRYALDDADAVYELFADPYARQFYPQMSDRSKARLWIEWNLRNYTEHGFGLWATELRSTGEFIGDCGLTLQEVEGHSELEIGYHIVLGQRRHGYATEAARACLEAGFRETPAPLICSIVRPDNVASFSVAARIHTARREFVKHDRAALLFYTTRDQYENRAER